MTNLDDLIRRALDAEVADIEPSPDALDRLHAEIARPHRSPRGRWTLLAVAASIVVVLVAVAVAAVDHDDQVEIRPSGQDNGRPTPSTATTAPPPPTTSTPTSQSPASGPATPLPADFLIRSSTWISPQNGWVVGTQSCGSGQCSGVAHTTDQATSWELLGDLPVDVGFRRDVTTARIRFANANDGWLSGVGAGLLTTHDGGRTWTQVSVPGVAQPELHGLETAHGVTWALIAPPDQWEETRLYTTRVGSDDWQLVPGAVNDTSTQLTSLAVNGPTVFVSASTDRPVVFVGSSPGSLVARDLPDDCVAPPLLAPWHEQRLFIVCQNDPAAGSIGKHVYVSTDGGQRWERRGDPPLGGMANGAAAADDSTLAITASSGASFLYASHDGGQTWETPLEIGDGGIGLADLGFTTPDIGVAVYGEGQLYRTTDGGHEWTPAAP
jgi:photosystem II stability/assembly factor-like uncharacterized protein